MKKRMNKIVYAVLIAGSVAVSSCGTEDLDPTLAQEKLAEEAINTVEDMAVLVLGAYNRMSDAGYYGRDYYVTSEVHTANTYSNGNSGRFTTEALFRQQPTGTFIWDEAYATIASANLVINKDISTLVGPTGAELTESEIARAKHVQGEAYAIRALAHFDLLKVYGQEHVGGNLGVPYVTEFLGEDRLPARPTIEENKQMIYDDLDTAFEFMSEDFFDASKETMSKFTAAALESRVAVYFGDWPRAKESALSVVESGKYAIIPAESFVESFAADGSVNSLFEIAVSATDNQGSNGMEFIYRGRSYGDISVTEEAYNDLYKEGDVREDILGTETIRVGPQFRNMGKFPDRDANIPVIRYEEVILNLAEAKFELSEDDALDYLNMVPEHREEDEDVVLTYDTINKANIIEERRKEFIFEGIYFWDLLRTGQDIVRTGVQEVMIPYGDFRLAYPIPFVELDANSNIEQNPGYASN